MPTYFSKMLFHFCFFSKEALTMIEKRVIRVFYLTSIPFQGFSNCAKTYQFHLKIYQASISFIFEDFIVQIELACILKK